MGRKWKILSALCLAAAIAVLAPLSVNTASANGNAPAVGIKYQDRDLTQSLGGVIEYNTYIGNSDQSLSILVAQDAGLESLSYYLDETGGSTESKNEEQLSALWQSDGQSIYQKNVALGRDGKYVLYVKAAADNGQATYARTSGVVVDTIAPVIKGVQEGGAYPLGTKFEVEDDNLSAVLVNEDEVSPSADGKYQVAANGTSCVIRAKDMAGHETTCSITISGESGNPGGDNPPNDDTTVINNSGTYSLKAGTAYSLGSGSWTLQGDNSVYSGGVTFYVNTDGDYIFKKQ